MAISAGLAQNPGHTHTHHRSQSPARGKPLHSSPRIRPTIVTDSPRLAPILEPNPTKVNGKSQEQPENIKKSIIRVDAFLGEWLSPDYFEQITPPPSSIMMVAGAKADLLRREDYSNLIHVRDINTAPVNQGFPGGWGSPVVVAAEKDKDDSLSNLSSLGAALPRRDRTSSLSSVGSNGTRHGSKSAANVTSTTAPVPPHAPGGHGVYQPPIPGYAISLSDPIPAGYVAHARDACVDVDYQWDSMREPQNWGNGGEYGEEWSSMHKRFRKGLQQLVGWYRDNDDPGKLLTKTPGSPGQSTFHDERDSDDVDTDLVIILVTHGAGCNALIGALTSQPVLMDVGMASLTMAVRKPTPKDNPSTPGATPKSHSRASSKAISISDEYDVMLTANTEHLRSTSSTPLSSRTPSLAGLPAFRDRYGNGGAFDNSFSNKSRPITANSSFGSIRRTASVAGSTQRTYSNSPRQMSIGLWSAPQPQEEAEEQEDDMILNFGNTEDEKRDEEKENEEECACEDPDEEDEVAPLGLWGTPRPPGYAEKIREIAPKRRWTVNERQTT